METDESNSTDSNNFTSLMVLGADVLCNVIVQFGTPIQIKDLVNLLKVSQQIRGLTYECVTEIDFTNGISLLNDYSYSFPEVTIDESQLASVEDFLEPYTRIHEYRINYEAEHSDDNIQFLIFDPRARYLGLKYTSTISAGLDSNHYYDELLNDIFFAFNTRIKKYGSKFTLCVTGGNIEFRYSDGIMIDASKNWKALVGTGAIYRSELIHTLAVQADTDGAEVIPTSVTRLVLLYGDAFGQFDLLGGLFLLRTLYRFTEILFCPFDISSTKQNPSRPNMFIRSYRLASNLYLRPFIAALREGYDINKTTYPAMIKFEVPIPKYIEYIFRAVFPNVLTFNYIEPYGITYLKTVLKFTDRSVERTMIKDSITQLQADLSD